MKKVLIKFLKWCLRKLGGVKRIEYNMPEREKQYIKEVTAIQDRYNSKSFQNNNKSVELKENYLEPLQFFFDYDFKINFSDIPSSCN